MTDTQIPHSGGQTFRRPLSVRSVRSVSRLLLAAVVAAASAVVWTAPSVSAGGTFVVTTTADSGAGSLRAAITAVNADSTATAASPAAITFNIPAAGVQTISVLTALPQITKPVIIDGLSQPGATCGDAATPRKLLISIRGQGNTVAMSGLFLTGGHSTVQGLAISFFRSGGLNSTGATGGDLIRCNHLGTRADGVTVDTLAANGVTMTGNPTVTSALDISSPNTVVGGTNHTVNKCDGDCNVVVGESGNNTQQAIILRFGPHTTTAFNGFTSTSSAAGGSMKGNFFGILANGDTPPSALKSARILSITSADSGAAAAPLPPQPITSSGGYLIGGLNPDGTRDDLAANVISAAKFRDGVDSDTGTGGASGIKVYGNYIGTGPGGTSSVDAFGRIYGNARDGIQLEGQESIDIQANVIAGNGSNGINAGSISSNSLIKNNLIGQLVTGVASGNGWFSTAITSGPNLGIGGATTNANAGSGNGISIGAYGATTPNRDVANLVIDGNTIVNSSRAGIIAVGGSGNSIIKNNIIGQGGQGNLAAGVVMMTADNTIQNNVISYNGGAGVTILRNTNPLMGTVFGAFTPLPSYASKNLISSNSIFANTGLGIDLAAINSPWAAGGNTLAFPYAWSTGVTGNNGALSVAPPIVVGGFGNRDQDYPVITSAVLDPSAGILTVTGHVGSIGGSAAFGGSTVEVFQGNNSPADQNGEVYAGDGLSVVHPEGQTLLGTCPVSAAGTFSCSINVIAAKLIEVPMLTATATLGHATSEFGPIFNAQVLGTISGSVYLDGSLAGIEGVTIELRDGGGTLITATHTDIDGNYFFGGLPMGDYAVVEIQPANYGEGAVEPDDSIPVTLATSTPDSPNNDFSEAPGSISGTVYLDGTLTPLKDVKITLTGTDAHGHAIGPVTVLTDADGNYSFSNLPAGDYLVIETQPPAYGDGLVRPTNQYKPTLTAGGKSAGNDFSEKAGLISGQVFLDGSGDPIKGVEITLTGDSAFGPVHLVTHTAGDGTYSFPDLPSGSYIITEAQPDGYGEGAVEPDDVIEPVILEPGWEVSDQDFSETLGSISGNVSLDDGPAIGGVEITLTGTDVNENLVSLTTHTDSHGNYTFDNLLAGDYTITETQPAGYGEGAVEPDDTITATLKPGATIIDQNFTEVLGSISGKVYVDGSNAPIEGVLITLTGKDVNGDPVNLTTHSLADGSYSFTGILAGDYTITESQPADWADGFIEPDNSIPLTLSAGGAAEGNDFSESGLPISGKVYIDDTNDPIKDVTITLTGTTVSGDTITLTTQTLADGSYEFVALPLGDYTVTEAQPTGYGEGIVEPDDMIDVTLAIATGGMTSNNFSETLASISGKVYIDGTGTPLAGVTITLTGIDINGHAITPQSATTALDGSYTFTGLLAGDYTITETQPAEYGEGAVEPDDVIEVTLTAGVASADNDLSERAGTISGVVSVEPSDAPIAGVEVVLTGTDVNGAAVSLTAYTSVDGSYTFTGLLAGDYTITETQPAGYGEGTVQADDVINVSLAAGATADHNDFSEALGSIAGTVYLDGTLAPLSGVHLILTGSDINGDAVNAAVITGADGSYRFTGLLAGDYTITETQPADWLNGAVAPSNTLDVTLDAGTNTTGVDFSETGQTIAGSVNLDGTGDPVEGVEITLTGTAASGDPITLVTHTLADGSYSFTGLPNGDYTITETQPAMYGQGVVEPDGVIAVTLDAASGDQTGNDFTEATGSISGFVRIDGTGAPISGVTITLTGTDAAGHPVAYTTMTGIDGGYTFTGLPIGDYTIVETQPAGYGNGHIEPDNTITVALTGGHLNSAANDFSETVGSVSGRVFVDGTNMPLGGVTVTLTGTDAAGHQVSQTTVTGDDGTYQFTNLLAGTYTITETQPDKYQPGVVNPGNVTHVSLAPGAVVPNNNFSEASNVVPPGPTGADSGSVVAWASLTGAAGLLFLVLGARRRRGRFA